MPLIGAGKSKKVKVAVKYQASVAGRISVLSIKLSLNNGSLKYCKYIRVKKICSVSQLAPPLSFHATYLHAVLASAEP